MKTQFKSSTNGGKKMNNLEKAKELKEKAKPYQNKSLNEKEFIEYMLIVDEVHKLKEKIENEGCGKNLLMGIGVNCGIWKNYCSDCEEAIKICEEILK